MTGRWLEKQWRRKNALTLLLLPLSWLFCGLVALRKLAYTKGWKKSVRLPVPVIVVGNITVGGAGKTPFAAWLATTLKKAGYNPGIVSRGYGGSHQGKPILVHAQSNPLVTGDEPVLLARRAGTPVAVCADRVEAAKLLIGSSDCDVIVADDGLQHLRLQRDIECAVVDADRIFGNNLCLPAGMLREKSDRLLEVDIVVFNGKSAAADWSMELAGDEVVALSGSRPQALANFAGKKVHAVAGIGNPERFFRQLEQSNIQIIEHAFPDHHVYRPDTLDFGTDFPTIMTEKDAVKCENFAKENWYYLPVKAKLDAGLAENILEKLKEL